MKKIFFCLALLVLSLPVLRADDSAPAASSSQADKKDKFMAMMEQIDLNSDQKAKIKQIMANTQPGPERRQQVAEVLTPQQKLKMRQLMKEQQTNK